VIHAFQKKSKTGRQTPQSENDLKLDAGVGACGKGGQSVPVGVGQPTLKIEALTVGGTRTRS
jgi:predicted Zn-dependent protease